MARDNPGGRPLKFKSAAGLEKKIDEYFEECAAQIAEVVMKDGSIVEVNHPRVPTMSGLAVHLEISRKTLIEYGKRDKFRNSISRARARVEAATEAALYSRETCNGAKFALMNNFGWREKNENDTKLDASDAFALIWEKISEGK